MENENSIFYGLPTYFNLTHHLIEKNKNNLENTAVIEGKDEFSYLEIVQLIKKSQSLLFELGIKPGDRVAIVLEDGLVFYVLFLSLIATGVVPVLINAMMGDELVKKSVMDANLSLIITSKKYADFFNKLLSIKIVLAENLKLRLPLGEQSDVFYFNSRKEELAFIAYTSGSSGIPKGVMHAHYSPIVACEHYAKNILKLSSEDIILSGPPLAFTYGLGVSLYMPMYFGAKSILVAKKDAFSLVSCVNQYAPTMFFGVPSHYANIVSIQEIIEMKGESLRLCVSAGERLPVTLWQNWFRLFDLKICEGLGTTESTHIFISNDIEQSSPGTLGKVVPGYQVKLSNDGKLMLAGEGMMLGYWGKRAETKSTLNEDCLLLNDIYRKENDYFYYLGREDDMLKINGLWVSTMEIEEVSLSLEGISLALVLPITNSSNQDLPELILFVEVLDVSKKNSVIDQLKFLLKQKLPKFKIPRKVISYARMPLLATGKIDRGKLRSNYISESVYEKKMIKCVCSNVADVKPIPSREANLRILLSPKVGSSSHLIMGHSTMQPGEALTKHIHDYSDEVFYVLNGTGLLVTDTEEIKFISGDAIYIPKKTPHFIKNIGNTELAVVFCVSPLAPNPRLGHRELIDIGENQNEKLD